MTKTLADVLNVEPIQRPEKTALVAKPVVENDAESKAEEDLELARNNIKRLLAKGEEALDGILYLAESSDHPRAYEVAGQIVKTLVDANKDLIGLHKTRKAPEKASTVIEPTVTNNSIFVGTTNDLQKLLKEQRDKSNDVV